IDVRTPDICPISQRFTAPKHCQAGSATCPRLACAVRADVPAELGPGGGGEGEPRTGGVLGVADVDGGGAEGYLYAVAVPAAAVAALEPSQFGAAHSTPRIRSSRLLESPGERACERSLA